MHWNLLRKVSAFGGLLCSAIAFGQVSVTTYHNDNARTGLNNHESILTPSNVNPNSFGLLFTLPVDGYVYAQPLYLPKLDIPHKGTHNVVFVATEHDSVYAFDADGNTGANSKPLWHVNLGSSVPSGDTNSGDINPEIGITGTPVIEPASNGETATLYVVAKTKGYVNGNPVYYQKLHALDVTTGAEKFNGPKLIQAVVDGVGDGNDSNGHVPWQPLIQSNRGALLLMTPRGGAPTIYIPYASHGDNGPYHGWILAYDARTLRQVAVFNTTPNALTDVSGYPLAAGGIWQSGCGMASDGTNIFCATGNGTFDPSTSAYGDAVIRVLPTAKSLQIGDYFAPSDQQTLDDYDTDLGSGGLILLPPSVGSSSNPDLLVQSGKEGTLYLLDRHNLGKNSASDNVVQELPYVMGGIWGSPAYFNGSVYFGPQYSSLLQFTIQNGQFVGSGPTGSTNDYFNYPGPTPSISSNEEMNGIVWAIESDTAYTATGASLHAYQAGNLGNELYNSNQTNGRDTLAPPAKFVTPTIAHGKVYVGTSNSVGVFGLGRWVGTPVISPASGNYTNSVSVTVTDPTPGCKIYYTLDGSTPTQSSNLYSGPVTVTQCANFTARAFEPGYGPSPQIVNYYQINAMIGAGNGLYGQYYNNSQDPSGSPTNAEVDPVINFNWNGNSPISGVSGDNWAAQWTGQIEAECTTTYTFYTDSDDGVRVWVNGQEIINDWTYHAPTYDSGTISLVGGQRYTIEIQYFQGGGGSLLQLDWSSLGMPFQLVPQSQLYAHPIRPGPPGRPGG